MSGWWCSGRGGAAPLAVLPGALHAPESRQVQRWSSRGRAHGQGTSAGRGRLLALGLSSGVASPRASLQTGCPSYSAFAASLVPLGALAARFAAGRRPRDRRTAARVAPGQLAPQGARLSRALRTAAAAGPDAKTAGPGKLVLLGDSVLDNFYWLMTPQRPLRVQLAELLEAPPQAGQQRLAARLECVNLAVDQTTTFDLKLRRPENNPWDVFAAARKKVNFADPQDSEYLTQKDGTMQPLRTLEGLENVAWVVLSVGGNDVYLRGDIRNSLASSLIPPFAGRRQEVADAFGERLRAVIGEVRRAAPEAQLLLVIPYQPHNEFSLVAGAPINAAGERIQGDVLGDFARGFERQVLSDLVTPLVRQILAVAREHKCPVIDLSKTFDPTAEEHYGTGKVGSVNELGVPWSGAEPSDTSTGFIAGLIAHAVSSEPRAVVYRGIPRQGGGQASPSVLVKEEENNVFFEEDYRFGPGASQEGDNSAAGFWFGFGVFVALILNGAIFIDLVANKDEFEALVNEAVAAAEAQKQGQQQAEQPSSLG